ncbi:hypothetical protein PoB_000551300 [Plakobranchus ocellatus]|uniref:Uncharacterized protein n=1 Tax=Plakobranchus ocellatus TaxID=259542 RepID=A0AAV3Y919_9GAST|nr:hypothetical protein PoB_000551300 [Plakobranchus ocellatus]
MHRSQICKRLVFHRSQDSTRVQNCGLRLSTKTTRQSLKLSLTVPIIDEASIYIQTPAFSFQLCTIRQILKQNCNSSNIILKV